MKTRLLFALTLTACNPYKVTVELEVGTCYYEGGDIGGTPNILHCVQAKGNDGFLRCQGSRSDHKWRWYACRNSERFDWLRKPVTVQCPTPCPDLSDPD